MFHIGVLGLALAASPVPLVPVDAPAPVPVVRADDSSPPSSSDVRFGVGLGAGLPSGIELAPYVRPSSWLQLQAGLAHDGAALGISAGALVGALDWGFTPTLGVDAGHFFQGDMSNLSKVVGVDLSRYPSAKNFDCDHVDFQGGVLFGGRSVQLFLRGGVSVVHATLHDFGASLQAASHDTTLTADDPTLTAWVPSARAGLLVTF